MPRTCCTDANVMREGADMIRKVVIALGAVSVIVLAQPVQHQFFAGGIFAVGKLQRVRQPAKLCW